MSPLAVSGIVFAIVFAGALFRLLVVLREPRPQLPGSRQAPAGI
jgi:hypothetical protein